MFAGVGAFAIRPDTLLAAIPACGVGNVHAELWRQDPPSMAYGPNHRKKGRGERSRFARLDHALLLSNAYRALSPNARALLVELTMMENGRNNGVGLYLSVRDAAARMGVVDLKAVRAAFQELMDLGFIDVAQDAYFEVKASTGSRARYWRLTWQAVNGERGPSNEFLTAEPAPKTAAHKRMLRGQEVMKRWKRERSES